MKLIIVKRGQGMLKKIIVIIVVSMLSLLQLDASHESHQTHHSHSASWAYPLPPLHHVKISRHAHSRKPSTNDKNYYDSLVLDALTLSNDIQGFLLNIATKKKFDSMLVVINDFNKAKNQVAKMSMFAEELKEYGTGVSNNEIIARAETIRLECESYTKQLHEIETNVLPDVQQLELVSVEHSAISRPHSGDLVSVAVDEMKMEQKDNALQSSQHSRNNPMLVNIMPPSYQLQSVSTQHRGHHHSRGHSLTSVRIPQVPVQHHVEQPLTPGVKACLGVVSSVLVIGMTLAILHFQGHL